MTTDTLESVIDDQDVDMKYALLSIQKFCEIHKCNRYSSKYCAWCLDDHDNIQSDYRHRINRSMIAAMLADTVLQDTEGEVETTITRQEKYGGVIHE